MLEGALSSSSGSIPPSFHAGQVCHLIWYRPQVTSWYTDYNIAVLNPCLLTRCCGRAVGSSPVPVHSGGESAVLPNEVKGISTTNPLIEAHIMSSDLSATQFLFDIACGSLGVLLTRPPHHDLWVLFHSKDPAFSTVPCWSTDWSMVTFPVKAWVPLPVIKEPAQAD